MSVVSSRSRAEDNKSNDKKISVTNGRPADLLPGETLGQYLRRHAIPPGSPEARALMALPWDNDNRSTS